MRAKTVTTLLLAGVLAACGGAQDDSGGMMDDGSGMMEDSTQVEDAMASDMMEEPAMEQNPSAMEDGSMTRDTSEMRRP